MIRLARPVVVLFAYRLTAGFVVAYPLARTAGAFGASSLPDGDLSLFAPGGMHLVETLRLARHAAPAALEGAAAVLAVLGLVGLVPLAVALAALSDPGARWPALLARSAECLPRLLFLGGSFVLLNGALFALLAVAMRAAGALGESLADERAPAVAAAFAGLPLVTLVLALGVIQDLARAAIVHRDRGVLGAIRDALGVARSWPGRVLLGWLVPALAGVATLGVAAWLTSAIDVGRPGSFRVAAVLGVHQAAVLAVVTLRVVWLARATDLLSWIPPGGAAGGAGVATAGATGEAGDPKPGPDRDVGVAGSG